MASQNVQEFIEAPAEAVWELLSDFGGLQKYAHPGFVIGCDCDGSGVGALRTVTMADGSQVLERLERLEKDARRLSYSILGECKFPVKDYLATVKVTSLGEKRCQVDWQSTFEALGPTADLEELFRGVYTGGVIGIRKRLGV
jgi:hypothetical protein